MSELAQRDPAEVARAGMRGAIAAMAMTGMRVLTVELGIVKQTPPEAMAKERARGFLRKVPRKRRRAVVEVAHWTYGAFGGATFALLPDSLRRQAWAGPGYGLAVWLGFEFGIAPVLRLSQSKRPDAVQRIALAVDHLLYGLVLSETRMRPQE
jgi:hypothetical protein